MQYTHSTRVALTSKGHHSSGRIRSYWGRRSETELWTPAATRATVTKHVVIRCSRN